MTMTTCRKCWGEVARKEKNAHIVMLKNLGIDGRTLCCLGCSYISFGGILLQ